MRDKCIFAFNLFRTSGSAHVTKLNLTVQFAKWCLHFKFSGSRCYLPIGETVNYNNYSVLLLICTAGITWSRLLNRPPNALFHKLLPGSSSDEERVSGRRRIEISLEDSAQTITTDVGLWTVAMIIISNTFVELFLRKHWRAFWQRCYMRWDVISLDRAKVKKVFCSQNINITY